MNTQKITPMDHLRSLAERSLGSKALTIVMTASHEWRGYVCHVGGWNLVFPYSEGFEIVMEHEIHPIPWVARWVRGLTNIRGEIHSAIDFSDFLGLGEVPPQQSSVLLKLPDKELKSALFLQNWVNLRSFPNSLRSVDVPELPPRLATIVSGVVEEQGQLWLVLDTDGLCRMAEFISITHRSAEH